MHDAADLEQFILVIHHLLAGEASDGVIFAQKNRLLRANFLAHAAIDAADHVDIEFLRVLFHFGKAIFRRNLARDDFDGARRADEFAKLAGHATDAIIGIADEGGRAAVIIGHLVVPALFRVLHGHFGAAQHHVFEVLNGNEQSAQNGRQIKPLRPSEIGTQDAVSHIKEGKR